MWRVFLLKDLAIDMCKFDPNNQKTAACMGFHNSIPGGLSWAVSSSQVLTADKLFNSFMRQLWGFHATEIALGLYRANDLH